MRSFLTMLGVIIGIASIIAIVSTIAGTNQQIMQNLIGAGNNSVTISLQQGGGNYWMDAGAPDGVTPVSDQQREDILALDSVADASFYTSRSWVDSVNSVYGNFNNGSLLGIDTHYLKTVGLVVSKGRPFIKKDYTDFHKVVLLDEIAASSLFPDVEAVGNMMEIRGEPFMVVGVVRKADNFKPVINSFEDYLNYSQEEYGTVMIPSAVWPIPFIYDEPENCVVRAKETEMMSRAGREAAEIMNQSIGSNAQDITYKAEDLLERAKNQQELASSTNSLLLWVASIALLVGGIGVMNIMLVSVTERTAARRRDRRHSRTGALPGDLEDERNAGRDIGAGDHPLGRFLDADRHRVRTPALGAGGQLKPDRRAQKRIRTRERKSPAGFPAGLSC